MVLVFASDPNNAPPAAGGDQLNDYYGTAACNHAIKADADNHPIIPMLEKVLNVRADPFQVRNRRCLEYHQLEALFWHCVSKIEDDASSLPFLYHAISPAKFTAMWDALLAQSLDTTECDTWETAVARIQQAFAKNRSDPAFVLNAADFFALESRHTELSGPVAHLQSWTFGQLCPNPADPYVVTFVILRLGPRAMHATRSAANQ